jgi:hypothetical protein
MEFKEFENLEDAKFCPNCGASHTIVHKNKEDVEIVVTSLISKNDSWIVEGNISQKDSTECMACV